MRQIIKNVTILTTAIMVALALITPAIFSIAASAAPLRDKACGDNQFPPIESDKAITIETSENQYSVGLDYYIDAGGFDPNPNKKNVGAEEPSGAVLLPGGETISITVESSDDLSSRIPEVTLYSSKVSECEILLGPVKAKDTLTLEVVDVQQVGDNIWQLTVLVPAASEIGKQFTQLAVRYSTSSESSDLYILSGGVQII